MVKHGERVGTGVSPQSTNEKVKTQGVPRPEQRGKELLVGLPLSSHPWDGQVSARSAVPSVQAVLIWGRYQMNKHERLSNIDLCFTLILPGVGISAFHEFAVFVVCVCVLTGQ